MSFDFENGKLEYFTNDTDNFEFLNHKDASWIMICSLWIYTMQTGFALLECGFVRPKNMVNILLKNAVDVIIGGLSYWMFGYAFSFGKPSNAFCGFGNFFFSIKNWTHDTEEAAGSKHVKYFFQFSFATTATTIVSGAVAERMKLSAYIIFSFFNTLIYCFPASWAWNRPTGFLYKIRFFDYSGSCVVHLVGGTSAVVAALMIGPRKHRFQKPEEFEMSSPVSAMVGTLILWWTWLAFNCGSTFGITGALWKVSGLVGVNTMNGSISGAIVAIFGSMVLHKGIIRIDYIILGVLSGLVSVTGINAVTNPVDSLIIGAIGTLIAIATFHLLLKLQIDDPVGVIPVHFASALWGTLAVGLFGDNQVVKALEWKSGLFYGGGWNQLVAQVVGAASIMSWSAVLTASILFVIKLTTGLRIEDADEIMGCDWTEHKIRSSYVIEYMRDIMAHVKGQKEFFKVIGSLQTTITEDNNDKEIEVGNDRLSDTKTIP